MAEFVERRLTDDEAAKLNFPRFVKIGANGENSGEPGYVLIFQEDTDAPEHGYVIDSDGTAEMVASLAYAAARLHDRKVLAAVAAVGVLIATRALAGEGADGDNT